MALVTLREITKYAIPEKYAVAAVTVFDPMFAGGSSVCSGGYEDTDYYDVWKYKGGEPAGLLS